MFNDLPGTITAIATLLLALSATLLTWRNALRAERVERLAREAADTGKRNAEIAEAVYTLIKQNAQKLDETGKAIDGRLTQLLETTNKLSRAEGKEEGRAEEKANGSKDGP